MATTRDMVKCAVVDFLGCWEVKGEANLSLTTKGGITTLAFTTTLGPPDTPLRPAAALPAPTTPCRRRRPGPARQERDRARVARHQAALALKRDQENQVPTNPSLTHNPISLETEEVVVEETEEAIVKKAASTGGMKTVDKSTIVVTTIEDKKKRRTKSTAQVLDPPSKITQLDGKEEHLSETDKEEMEDTDEVTELVHGVDMDGESYADLPPGVFRPPQRVKHWDPKIGIGVFHKLSYEDKVFLDYEFADRNIEVECKL